MLQSQIHKRINFNFDKQKLIFDTSHELFSFAKIDEGTKELLNSLRKNPHINYKKILDLGCGYGVIGIYLKKKFPSSDVLCTDRDSLAVDFTKHNAKLNNTKIEAKASLDFEKISDKFSFIITNFPAKLEKEGLNYFISKSSEFLEKDGTLAVVIVKELLGAMQEILKNEKILVSFKEVGKNYSVYHLNFKEKISSSFSYITGRNSFNINNKNFTLNTTSALREFDNPHIITNLILKLFEKKHFDSAVICNPNQGLIPLGIEEICKVKELRLASSDLLQLKMSSENLLLNNYKNFKLCDSVENNPANLLVWSLYEEDDKTIIEKLGLYLKKFKSVIIGGRLPVIKRVAKKINLNILESFEERGYGAIFINSLPR